MSAYKNWLRQQLKALVEHPDPDESHYDGIASLIADARRRAAAAGLPDAVRACKIRGGGLTVSTAREILAACLAATMTPTKRDALTVKQAAQSLGISERVVRDLVSRGELGHHRVGNGRGQIRILPRDLEDYRNRGQRGFKHLFV